MQWLAFQMFRMWHYPQNEITVADPLEKPCNRTVGEPNVQM